MTLGTFRFPSSPSPSTLTTFLSFSALQARGKRVKPDLVRLSWLPHSRVRMARCFPRRVFRANFFETISSRIVADDQKPDLISDPSGVSPINPCSKFPLNLRRFRMSLRFANTTRSATRLLLVGVIVLSIAGLARSASAATLCVNPDGKHGCSSTIGAAVSAASPGDVIQVSARRLQRRSRHQQVSFAHCNRRSTPSLTQPASQTASGSTA